MGRFPLFLLFGAGIRGHWPGICGRPGAVYAGSAAGRGRSTRFRPGSRAVAAHVGRTCRVSDAGAIGDAVPFPVNGRCGSTGKRERPAASPHGQGQRSRRGAVLRPGQGVPCVPGLSCDGVCVEGMYN